MGLGIYRSETVLLLSIFFFPQILYCQENDPIVPDYRSPNFKGKAFDQQLFTKEDASIARSLASDLARFAINLPVSSSDHTKAIALAWGGARNNAAAEVVIKADFYLRLGEYPKDETIFRGAPSRVQLNEAALEIIRGVRLLSKSESEASLTYASYCTDLIVNNTDLPDVISDFQGGNSDRVNWSVLIYGESDPGGDGVIAGGNQVGSGDSVRQFTKRQSLIKGLLVMDLGGSQVAGEASQMNATVQDGPDLRGPTTFRFNQDVGGSMQSALKEVQKFLTVKHKGFPRGKVVEFAFEEQYSNKDGPSAAVACSLMLDSLITGSDLDTKFAVTGDMNADGSVQPVGGIAGKVRGATNRDCTHIAIPRKNARSLVDWVVLGDVLPLINIQVFSIGNFEEASGLAVGPTERDMELQEAISTFADVQVVLKRPNGMSYLGNSHVRGRLQEVLKAAPNHESARLLLLYGSGRRPKTLSLRGSFDQIDRVTSPIMKVLRTGNIDNSAERLNNSMFALRRNRGKLDHRARDTSDALEDLSAVLKQIGESNTDRNSPRYRELFKEFSLRLEEVKAAYNALASDPAIQEELIQ